VPEQTPETEPAPTGPLPPAGAPVPPVPPADGGAPALTVPKTDAGLAFRAEMTAVDVFLRWWQLGLAAIVVALVAFLVYGKYQEWHATDQKRAALAIVDADTTLRDALVAKVDPTMAGLLKQQGYDLSRVFQAVSQMEPDQQTQFILSSPSAMRVLPQFFSADPALVRVLSESQTEVQTVLMFVDIDDDARGAIRAAAGQLIAVGDEHQGGEGARAYLEAADLYGRVGDAEQRRAALTKASATGKGLLHHVAETNLAEMDIDAGQVDPGLERLRGLTKTGTATLQQQAVLTLAQTLRDLDRDADAIAAYDDYIARWPAGPDAEGVQEQKAALATASPSAAPPNEPTPPTTPEAPAPETPKEGG
jgi:hypothetical protein